MSGTIVRALLDVSIRATAVAALVAIVLAAGRVRSSRLRHAAWTAVLGAMLTMPLLRSILPDLRVPFAAAWPQPAAEILSPNEETTAQEATAASTSPTNQRLSREAARMRVDAAPAREPRPQRGEARSSFILAAYALGVAVLAARSWMGWRAATRLTHRGRDISDECVRSTGVTLPARITIRESAAVVTPVTIATVAPAILVPVAWRRWPPDTLSAVLAHELAHVARRDPLIAIAAVANRCVFWFHPLAWWLEGAIARHAEEACDAVAVRAIGSPQRYAAVLVAMAEAVRAGGGRLPRHALGIRGRGALDRRVHRVLREAVSEASRVLTAGVAACCSVAIVAAAACRPEPTPLRVHTSAAIEQRDRALRAVLRSIEVQDYRDFRRANWEKAAERLDALESAVARQPDDLDLLRELLIGYWVRPSTEKRRAHILSLIERHPDAELAGSIEARLFPRDIDASFPGDPAGYEQAKAAWLTQADRADASAAVIGNAVHFFETADRSLAESLLLRAQARDPQGPWRARLGSFYARVLAGIRAPAPPNSVRVLTVGEPRTSYGVLVRQKLGESTDDVLLTAAGWSLARAGREPWVDFDPRLWAEWCLKRALQLNPEAVLAHTELLRVRRDDEYHGAEPLWSAPPERQYETVTALPEAERFARLPRLARNACATIDFVASWNDPNLQGRLELARRQARQYSRDALALAPKHRQHPQYGTAIYNANVTLGILALRDGDTALAVRYLMRASEAAPSEELVYGDDAVLDRQWNLAAELLRKGEREAVARFLTRMAEVNLARRVELRDAAAAIRRGETPRL